MLGVWNLLDGDADGGKKVLGNGEGVVDGDGDEEEEEAGFWDLGETGALWWRGWWRRRW